MEKSFIINKTGRAVAVIGVLLFALGTIVWDNLLGDPKNVLHVNSLSYSYYLIIFNMIALGVDSAASNVLSQFPNKQP